MSINKDRKDSMGKGDAWTNPEDGTHHPDMDKPINRIHEKIRSEKIAREAANPKLPKPRPPARAEQVKGKLAARRESTTDSDTQRNSERGNLGKERLRRRKK